MIKVTKFSKLLLTAGLAFNFLVALPVSATTTTIPVGTTRATLSSKQLLLEGGAGGFVNKYGQSPLSGGAGPFYGPSGMMLYRDRAVNSGGGTHGGSYYKLFDRNGRRLGTYDYYGNYLRP